MYNNFKYGACLVKIMGVELLFDKNNKEFYKLNLQASNLVMKNQKVNICIFKNSFSLSIDDFIELIGTNDEKKMIGKLFYCNIQKNNKGYPSLKDFYMTVDSSKLLFDPRKKVLLAKKIEKEVSIKGLIGG